MIKTAILAILIAATACNRSRAITGPTTPDANDTTVPNDLAHDTIIFHHTFEDGHLNVWDDWDKNPAPHNVLLENPGPFNEAGNHVLRLRVPPGRGGSDVVKLFAKSYDKLYARWYAYWEPGYDFNAPTHGSGLFAGDRNYLGQSDNRPKGNDFATAWFEPAKGGRPFLYTYYRGMYQDCTNPEGGCWGDHFPCFVDAGSRYCTNAAHQPATSKLPPVLTAGKWYCIEVMIDLGKPVINGSEADGVLNFWIDGVEYGPWTKMWFRTTANVKLTLLSLALFHHSQHSVEGMLIDDVVVSTQPIGK